MGEDINLELSKILAKTMQNSYKKKEIQETVERIIEKTERLICKEDESGNVRKLRMELEEIRKEFFGLK